MMAFERIMAGPGPKGLVSIGVEVNAAQLAAVEAELAETAAEVPKVCRRAINRTAEGAVTLIAQKVSETIAVGQRELRRRNLGLSRARDDRLEATVRIFGRRIPLKHFAARQTRPGVTYQLLRAGGRRTALHAFLATMASGHVGVFARRLRGGRRVPRKPIQEMYGPSVPAAVEGIPELAKDAMEQTVAEKLEANLDHELRFVLMRRAGRA